MLTTETIQNQIKRACTTCAHFTVCIIPKATGQIIQQHFTPDTAPILIQDIANICKQYLSRTAVTEMIQNLKNAEENNQP